MGIKYDALPPLCKLACFYSFTEEESIGIDDFVMDLTVLKDRNSRFHYMRYR